MTDDNDLDNVQEIHLFLDLDHNEFSEYPISSIVKEGVRKEIKKMTQTPPKSDLRPGHGANEIRCHF